MAKSFLKLAKTGKLANATEETFIYLLERDDLAEKEVVLFQFILDWGKYQAGVKVDEELSRNRFKNLIPKIRYTNMDPNEFTNVVVPTGLLTAQENLLVYAFLSGDATTRRGLKIKFNTSPRKWDMRATKIRIWIESNYDGYTVWYFTHLAMCLMAIGVYLVYAFDCLTDFH